MKKKVTDGRTSERRERMKEILGWALLAVGFALFLVQLILPAAMHDSIPGILGDPSGTIELIVSAVLLLVPGVLVYFGVCFLADTNVLLFDNPKKTALVLAMLLSFLLFLADTHAILSARDEMCETSIEVREYVDPDTGVHYWVQDGTGMTPRLNPDGTIMVTSQE